MEIGKENKEQQLHNQRVEGNEYLTGGTDMQNLARMINPEGPKMCVNTKTQDTEYRKSKRDRLIQQINDYNEELDRRQKELMSYTEKIMNDVKDEEIMPVYEGVLIKPFKQNPFQREVKTKSGIIIDTGGAAPIYKAQEDGQFHEEENAFHWGLVIDVGPTCNYVKRGDIVMWMKPAELPIPFYKNGFVLVYEHSIKVFVGKGLKKRLKQKDNDK